jgi:DNA-binding LacI/PurR family transcriptional regulator
MVDRPRISDIARECGVSISTVSLVLNNRPGVSDETRGRVLQVAEQMNYPLSISSSSSSCSPLNTVAMVVKIDVDISPQANPFYSKIIMGIEDVCRRSGINLLFTAVPVDDNNRPLEIPQLIHTVEVDGLLMIGTFIDQEFAVNSARRFPPMVLVDGYSENDDYDAVVSDNFTAAYRAVTYLIRKGHRHIAMAGSSSDLYPSLRDRRNGYLRALKENDISETYAARFNINQTHGYDEILSLLKTYPHITAIFGVNDDVGSAAIRAVNDLGKRVPVDVSILSFDDTYIASNSRPGLTTMHVDTLTMGRAAVRLLSLRVENPESARMTLTVHPWLVERESVGTTTMYTALMEVPPT